MEDISYVRLEDFITRADQLIGLAHAVLKTKQDGSEAFSTSRVDETLFAGFRTASLSFLQNVYGPTHPYYTNFDSRVASSASLDTEQGKGILQAVRDELVGGWLRSAKGLVAAELFADFLEMAQHLLNEGYKDAAAVMIGSVLEEHLRQLSLVNGISINTLKDGIEKALKADAINANLAKANVYGMLDQKSITAWLDLRNKAAHGHYSAYTAQQVTIMHSGVLEFMSRISI